MMVINPYPKRSIFLERDVLRFQAVLRQDWEKVAEMKEIFFSTSKNRVILNYGK